MAWQVVEEGFDARPGDTLSWRVAPVDPTWTIAFRGRRSIDFMVDTYLHPEGALPPGFMRLDGNVELVEAVATYDPHGPDEYPAISEVATTLGDYGDSIDSFIVTLRPGACTSKSSGIDDLRYETSRTTT